MSNTIIRGTVAAAALVALAGCASPEDIRRADEAACASYGFQPGTPAFAGCIQREVHARRFELQYGAGWGPWGGPFGWR